MDLAVTIARQVAMMFLLMGVGFVLAKTGKLTESGVGSISNVLLYVVMPVTFINTYQMEYEADLIGGLLFSILLSFAAHLVWWALNKLVFLRGNGGRAGVERFSLMFSNAIFIGFPLVQPVFGNVGILYLVGYVTVFNIMVWTVGAAELKRGEDGSRKIEWKSLLLTPGIIAAIAGFVLYITKIRYGWPLKQAMDYISALNTPLALMVVGAYIARTSLKKIFTNIRLYAICALRLILYPLVTLALFAAMVRLFDFPQAAQAAMVCLIAASTPAAISVVLMSQRFERDGIYAGEIVSMTTLLSIITCPLMVFIAGLVI